MIRVALSRTGRSLVLTVVCSTLVLRAETPAQAETPVAFRVQGAVEQRFVERATRAYRSVPQPLWELLAQHGWTVHASETVVEAAPFLRGRQPRGWPNGMTWEQTDAVHLPQQRMIVIAQYRVTRDGHRVAATRVGGVLRHELGHAIDGALADGHGLLSASPAFRDCYQQDVAQLRASEQLAGGDLDYYTRNVTAGPKETFAELFAEQYGSGSDHERAAPLRQAFPNCYAFIQQRVNRVLVQRR